MTHDGSSPGQLTDAMRNIASRIEKQRASARDFVDAQKGRLQGIELRLTAQLGEIDGQLDAWEVFQSETQREHLQLDEQRQALDQDRAEVASRLSEAEQRAADSHRERERMAQELEQRQQTHEQLESQLRERESRLEDIQRQLEESQSTNASEANQLRDECERLQQEVLSLGDPGPAAQAAEEIEDLRARLELALDDVRALKQQNEQLQEKLENMSTVAQSRGDQDAQGEYSWEEHKQRLLSDMAGGDDEEVGPWDEEQRSIADEAIQRTDEVVARMEMQIDQLRSQLEDHQKLATQVAQSRDCQSVQDAATLDGDEVIQEEREKLRQLQEEWTEKLRRAEVEIAVERAQNARQQSELDEKMRDLQAELDRIRFRSDADGEDTVQSRLMKRLGLGGK